MAAAGEERASQHPYWQANGGLTYRDPDGREVVFVSWTYGADRTCQPFVVQAGSIFLGGMCRIPTSWRVSPVPQRKDRFAVPYRP